MGSNSSLPGKVLCGRIVPLPTPTPNNRLPSTSDTLGEVEHICTPCCQTWVEVTEYESTLEEKGTCIACTRAKPNYVYRFGHRKVRSGASRENLQSEEILQGSENLATASPKHQPTSSSSIISTARSSGEAPGAECATLATSTGLSMDASDSTDPVRPKNYGAPEPTNAQDFVRGAFDRFIEALAMFQEYVIEEEMTRYIQTLSEESHSKPTAMQTSNITNLS